MKSFVVGALFVCAIVGVSAGYAEEEEMSGSAVVELWQCKLKDGVKIEDVKATNGKWVDLMNSNVEGGEGIQSHVLESIVGKPSTFRFADIFPSLEVWAAAKREGQSDAFNAVEAAFDEQTDCTSNALYNSTRS
jgi:hypothetical protein